MRVVSRPKNANKSFSGFKVGLFCLPVLATGRLFSFTNTQNSPVFMIDVACAILLRADGTALAARRGPAMRLAGFWEFPGGKIEPDESSCEALIREIREELGVQICLLRELPIVEHHYPDFSIRLHPWIGRIALGEPLPVEHAELRWLATDALPTLNWAAADVPVVEHLLELAHAPGVGPDLRRLLIFSES